ncbi:MAG: hypothetical protein L6435_02470 [Anaerolineae bacterium]|nr:hypothetical protein [Anaerolineae bacterium]
MLDQAYRGEAVAVDFVPNTVKIILRDITLRRADVMAVAVPQRAKYEGWLKMELAAALALHEGVKTVNIEPPCPRGGRADLSFQVDRMTWYVELKTSNTSWRADGLENRTRPISRNISRIITDIAKLREKCPPDKGLMVFTLFPVPTRIWNHDRAQLSYHLQRIERESGLARDSLLGQCDFVQLDE